MNLSETRETTLSREMFYGSLGPLIFAGLGTMTGALIDGIVISRGLGQQAMAAFSLVNPLYLIVAMIQGAMSSARISLKSLRRSSSS